MNIAVFGATGRTGRLCCERQSWDEQLEGKIANVGKNGGADTFRISLAVDTYIDIRECKSCREASS